MIMLGEHDSLKLRDVDAEMVHLEYHVRDTQITNCKCYL
jgi:hypothetical protein